MHNSMIIVLDSKRWYVALGKTYIYVCVFNAKTNHE